MRRNDWARVDAIALEVLAEHHGLAHVSAFEAAGLTRHQIAAVFRRGIMERPRFGWYMSPDLPWQAKKAVRVGGVATCVSAAATWDVPIPPMANDLVHVSVVDNASRFRHRDDPRHRVRAGEDDRVRMHWSKRLDESPGWRASPVDTLLQLAGCVPLDWYLAALDAALHRPRDREPLLSMTEFVRLVQHLPRQMRRALRRVDPRAESCIETLLRLGLVRRGIAPFDLQVWTHSAHRVDILVLGKLILEADGEEFHDPQRDAIRDALMRSLGYVVLRFTYERIVFDLEAVLDEIEAALAALVDVSSFRAPAAS